jgi:hypothetical protein
MEAPLSTPVVDPVANLRRSAVVALILGLATTVVSSLMGHPLVGVFALIGLSLGALNNRMLQLSVLNYASDPSMKKAQFSRKVLVRLAGVTLLAVAFALLVRPDGLAVFVGLAVFQVLMLVGATVPVFRSLKHS